MSGGAASDTMSLNGTVNKTGFMLLLLVATGVAVVGGVYLAVALLLGRLGLVVVPEHAVALRTAVAPLPLVGPALLASLIVVVVLLRGRDVGSRESAPAVLREEAR